MQKWIAWIVVGILALWSLLNFFGTLDFARSLVTRRGEVVKGTVAVLTSRWLPLVFFICAVAIFLYAQFGLPSWIWDSDLRMSVIRYGYDQDTSELSADVQFVNNGSSRRTVLGVVLMYRAKDDNGSHPFVRSANEIWGNGTPLYVEPGHPIVATYKHKLNDASLLQIPGEVFGLIITTLGKDGSMNFTTIEVMIITTGFGTVSGAETFAQLFQSKRNISLDTGAGYTRMEDPMVRVNQTTPTPSPK